jgi:hypothetical protein
MKGLVSLLVTAAIGLGIYMYTLKQAAPGPGMVATQNISVTGVKNDLVSAGTMNIARTSRDGYTYSAQPSGNTFTVTAIYTPPPVDNPAGVTPPHFPTFTIDQTMEVHQVD